MADIGIGLDWKDTPEMVMEEVNSVLEKKGLGKFVRMDDQMSDGSDYAFVGKDEQIPSKEEFYGEDEDEEKNKIVLDCLQVRLGHKASGP